MIFINKLILFVILCSITIISYSQDTTYKTVYNIPYYESNLNKIDDYLNERCKLDIYYPDNEKEFTTIVWFHGGGLTGGNKELPDFLKNKGMCIVGVNYRLSPGVEGPSYIVDAAAAVAWVFNNI